MKVHFKFKTQAWFVAHKKQTFPVFHNFIDVGITSTVIKNGYLIRK